MERLPNFLGEVSLNNILDWLRKYTLRSIVRNDVDNDVTVLEIPLCASSVLTYDALNEPHIDEFVEVNTSSLVRL